MPNNLLSILEREKSTLQNKLYRIEGLIEMYNQSIIEMETGEEKFGTEDQEDILFNKGKMSIHKYFSYDITQPIRKKIIDIIKNENRFLHVREIANIAHQFEENIPVSIFVRKISPALSVLKNLPQTCVVNFEVADSHFNTFWGSKAWLNEEGEIKSEYMYNSNQLFNLKKVIYSV